MKKKKINFDDFEIIKEGQISITGGTAGDGHPASTFDPNKPGVLPQACDNAGA